MSNAHKVGHQVVAKGLVLLAVLGLALPTMAAVSGYNDYLEQHEGKAYIPLKESTSGVLGGPQIGGGGIAGAKPDTLTLSGKDAFSGGWITYDLFFDLTKNMSPSGEPILYGEQTIDVATMDLFLDLVDLDFLPVFNSGRVYLEILELTFIRDDGDGGTSEGPSVQIRSDNYSTDFGASVVKTDNQAVTYVVNLHDDMGLTDDDFEQILDDMSFTVQVTVSSYMQRLVGGTGRYTNSLEYLGDYSAGDSDNGFTGDDGLPVNALDFELIPEPMTLALLSAGSIALLRRRKVTAG